MEDIRIIHKILHIWWILTNHIDFNLGYGNTGIWNEYLLRDLITSNFDFNLNNC